MPTAGWKLCRYPGCNQGLEDGDGNLSPYIRPEGIPTRSEVAEDLKQHVEMVHVLPLRLAKSKDNEIKTQMDKLRAETEKLVAELQSVQQQQMAATRQELGSTQTIVDKWAAIPWPSIDEGVNKSDRSFFVAQWGRYKSSTDLAGVSEVQRL